MLWQTESQRARGGTNMRRIFYVLAFVVFAVLLHLFFTKPYISRVSTPAPAIDTSVKVDSPPEPPAPPKQVDESEHSSESETPSESSHEASEGNSSGPCKIWPGFRPTLPVGAPVDDGALSSSRLGSPQVLGGSTFQECLPAADRLGPFGHSSQKGEREDRPWSSLRWGSLQRDCAVANSLVEPAGNTIVPDKLPRVPPGLDEKLQSSELDSLQTGRTAVVLRTWNEYNYYSNQLAWMRAMATELALDTGGHYQLFILVDMKGSDVDLSDPTVYAETLAHSVPEEFRDTAFLFNKKLLEEWFPKVDEHGAQDQMYQALQIFSFTFPEFDYIWQLEMDARLTGNVAHMLASSADWARAQPRKNLWERNAQFYIPGLWNNTYASFAAHVDAEFAHGQGVWGPHRFAEFYVTPQGPAPPARTEESWGVGEEAELITFAPMIDPVGSDWVYEHTIHGFEAAAELPRRMAIVSMTRTSRRLLRLISAEQRATGAWVVSESTPETWTLLHGLKAVYVPHLNVFEFEDGEKSPEELDEMLHKGPEWNRAGGERAGFLWCGNEIGMPEPRWRRASYFYWPGIAPEVWWKYTNGTCAYPLLLHPVKDD